MHFTAFVNFQEWNNEYVEKSDLKKDVTRGIEGSLESEACARIHVNGE